MTRARGGALTHWHLLTADFPPAIGGVADYTRLVALGLAAEGERVHVWCARGDGGEEARAVDAECAERGVQVHRAFARFTPGEFAAVTAAAHGEAAVRWLVQWVPHQYGWRALNVALPLWLGARHRAGDVVELMLHEGAVPFARGRWRQNVAAVVHRLMLRLALHASDRAWLSIPGWEPLIQSVGGRTLPPRGWLPVPSNVPVVADAEGVARWRRRMAPAGGAVVGHFGTFGGPVGELLKGHLPAIAARCPEATLVLVGAGSERAARELAALHPRLAPRLVGLGSLAAADVSLVLQGCDVMAQPYPDGVSGRRSSTLAPLAHGIPVVTNAGRLSEVVWHGGAVVLAPNEPAAFGAAVAGLLEDPVARARVAGAARRLYDALFAVPRTVAVLRGVAPAPSPIGLVDAPAAAERLA